MGKGQSPTADELKFVYDLLAQGYSDTDIIGKYEELNRHDKLGTLQSRQDVRFIRQRRKEFEAARAVLEGHIKKSENPLILDAKREHFHHLSEIAKALLPQQNASVEQNDSGGQFEYWLWEQGKGQGMTHKELGDMLWSAIDTIDERYSMDDFNYLLSHLEAEYPDFQFESLHNIVKNNPYELIQTLTVLAQRKIFKGTCPVCKDW
jgi:hypothetical protein